MVSDRTLGITTTALFGVSTLAWIITQALGMAALLSGGIRAISIIFTIFGVIGFLTRYAALVVGAITVFRTNRWNAGTGWLAAVWIITCWYGLLFLRDLVMLVIVVFGISMFGSTSGEAVGYSSIPARPPL